ncbi:hypothetical protein QMP28_11340 [[Clostridium] symbiosum]|uniref:hypothetical protein n=1 Tax=Clostridium symbiosum TaxID=1512 RepID=UPI003312FFA9
MKRISEKQILIAFFDILGTSQLLNTGEFHKVYDYYSDMIKLCNDNYTPITVCNPLFGKRELLGDLNGVMADLADFDTPYHIINYDLSHAFFSDTFLLWIEIDSFLRPLIGGFLEKCSIVFCEALKRGIPLRGTISVGASIMDEENHIFLGKPLAEAAKAEPHQKWLGIAIGKSIVDSIEQFHPMDMEYLLPFCNHLKYDSDPLLSNFVLDWFTYWNNNEDADVQKIIESMNIEIAFDNYYKNTLLYVMASKQRYAIWNEYMICQDIDKLKSLCEMGENIDEAKKLLRSQGIKLLTSDKIMRNIGSIINRNEAIWFSENNRNILSMFNNGFIDINGEKISLDYLKYLYR